MSGPAAPAPALTPEQELAVARRTGPLLLAAGAGSGKTSVLVERFVRAVREDGLAPAAVLAITFTDRAAGELRERVRARLLELGDREAARDTEAAFVGTFHSFCARLLRSHALLAGLDPEFTVLEEAGAERLRERAFADAVVAFQERSGAAAIELLAAYRVDEMREMVLGVHAELRSRGERLPRLPRASPAAPGDGEDDAQARSAWALIDELLAEFSLRYEQRKRERGAVDFDDLELLALALLDEREQVRSAWSERFALVMVDEFQDTNARQLAILTALERDNLFTVGDELQSIYGFRHADVELFRARRKRLAEGGASLALSGNFRSRPALIAAVNALFAERMGEAYAPLRARREEPTAADTAPRVELLATARAGWDADERLAAAVAAGLPHASVWRQAEARLLAQRVAELVRAREVAAGDVAVLLRAAGDIEVFERALQLQGLRTLAVVGGFWRQLQVRDLLCYLRTLANPLDEVALHQTLASPLAGVGSDALALLAAAARAWGRSVWATACTLATGGPATAERPDAARAAEAGAWLARIPAADARVLREFCEHVRDERAHLGERALAQLLELVLARGYEAYVLSLDWPERRIANVRKLLRLARRFEASEGRDLRAFVDHIRHLEASARPEPEAPVDGVEPDAVRLMTVHAAKGLEFPVVCVADLGRGPNTHVPRLLVDGDRVGLSLLALDGEPARPTLEYVRLRDERRAAQQAEEDRILYVAMTRARERLLLSGCVDVGRCCEQREATAMGWLTAHVITAHGRVPEPDGEVFDVQLGTGAELRCVLSAPGGVGRILRLDDPAMQPPAPPTGEIGVDEVPALLRSPSRSEAAVAAPAAAAVSTLSYTTLSELERCGYRYYLERVLGMPEEREGRPQGRHTTADARSRGTLVHRLLEHADLAGPPPSGEDVAAHAAALGMRVSSADRDAIADLLATAWASPPAARVARARDVRREHAFAFSMGPAQPLVRGVIDLLATERDCSTLVLDYKSDQVEDDTDLEALVEREYGVQRLLYALAVLRVGAPRVEVAHWFLERPREWVAAAFTADQREALEARLSARVRAALDGGFAVSASPHRALCAGCPGRVALCSWDAEETLREHPREALRMPLAGAGGPAAEDASTAASSGAAADAADVRQIV